jgi:hypothetical protein
MPRRILHVQGATVSVSEQTRFDMEQDLEQAIGAHPEVLPSEDLGLGPLIALGSQVDFGAGPIDLLVVDPQGRVAIVEFKRGSENPDVRKVVAQLLDYGSSLWRVSYDDFERRCLVDLSRAGSGLVELAAERCLMLDVPYDSQAFRAGIETSLDSGNFVFLYVGRDLDPRTQRIMTYLAEGPRMTFFGVEVDYYRRQGDDVAVLVPRTAFVPSWIAEPAVAGRATSAFDLATASADVRALIEKMEDVARELGLTVKAGRTGRNYQPAVAEAGVSSVSGVGVYASTRGTEFNLSVFRELGEDAIADELLAQIRTVTGESVTAPAWPAVPCASLLRDWPRTRAEVIEPTFVHVRRIVARDDRTKPASRA